MKAQQRMAQKALQLALIAQSRALISRLSMKTKKKVDLLRE